MADAYGNIIAGSWRVHLAAWVVSSTDKTDTIRVQARAQAVNGWNFAINGVNGSVSCDGQNGSGSGNFNVGTNGEATIYSRDFTVNRGESARSISCKATVSQYYFNGGSSSASLSLSIPRINYKKPNPPKNASFTRVSDTQIKVSWQGNWDNEALKPWKQVIIDRRKSVAPDGWSTWPTVKTLNWDATSVTLTDAQPNGRYQVAVYARNQAGDSSHVDSQVIYTTPAAPKKVTATKIFEGEVRVVADATNTYAWSIDFDRSVDGGATWTTISTGKTGTTVTISDNPPATGSVKYRARCWRYINGNGGAGLFSAYTESNAVTTITTPLAPTITSPTQTVFERGKTVNIEWNINHPDGTTQSNAQVEITMPDGSLQTRQINDAHQNYGLAATSSGTYKIRVRTKGLAADYGPWSNTLTIRVGDPPNIAITGPIGQITGVPFTIAWSVGSASGVSMQSVTLHSDTQSLTLQPSAGDRSIIVPAKSWAPDNGTNFTIEITVRDGIGLTSTETQQIDVTYTPPARPTADVTVLDGLSVGIDVHAQLFDGEIGQQYWTTALPDGTSVLADFYTFAPSDGTSVLATLDEGWPMAETEHIIVDRINPDGTVANIADNLDDGQTAIDMLPPLRVGYQYKVTAVAASGATASILVDYRIETNALALNFGPDASQHLLVGGAWTISEHQQITSAEYHFADAQRLPALYTMDSLDNDLSIASSYLWMDGSLYQYIRGLSRQYASCWLRNVDGSTMYASIDIQQSIQSTGAQVEFTANLRELEWQEPNHG